MTVRLSSRNAVLATVEAPTADVPTMYTALGTGRGTAVLRVSADGGVDSFAVHYLEDAAVPAGTVAVSARLATEIGVVGREWTLESVDPMPVVRLTIETATEGRVDHDVIGQVTDAPLAGRPLWVSSATDTWITVGDLPYRVRDMEPPVLDGVAEITTATRVSLFAAGIRTGVDLVVLADSSGSMGVDDIPDTESVGSWRGNITRSEALQRALNDLLNRRLRTSGRVSRMAIVSFDERTEARFPRDGGMAQLDGDSPAAVIADFENAVGRLLPRSAGTDIGNALYEGADLLYRYGHPGNDKVIVLVSDGANWVPDGDDATGEVVVAVREPITMMGQLHRSSRIRLHAVGISNNTFYDRWIAQRGRDRNPALQPDHGLLRELVKVGGGDPATIGGLDVLTEYFTGLGAGIEHRIPGVKPVRVAPPLMPAAAEALRAGRVDDGQKLREIILGLGGAAGECNELASERLQRPVFDRDNLRSSTQRAINVGVVSRADHVSNVTRFLAGAVRVRSDVLDEVVDKHRRLVEEVDELRNGSDPASALRKRTGSQDDPLSIAIAVAELLHDSVEQLRDGLQGRGLAPTVTDTTMRYRD